MSYQKLPPINVENVSEHIMRNVSTLGTKHVTNTAQVAAAKSLHAALLKANEGASVKELLKTTADLASALRRKDPKISVGNASNAMRRHLLSTGDLTSRALANPSGSTPATDSDADTPPVRRINRNDEPK